MAIKDELAQHRFTDNLSTELSLLLSIFVQSLLAFLCFAVLFSVL